MMKDAGNIVPDMIWRAENLKDYDDGHEISSYELFEPPEIQLQYHDLIHSRRTR
jgi:hypothetical protein